MDGNLSLLAEARTRWERWAGVPASFGPVGGQRTVLAPRSGLCPDGWVGVVALGGAGLVTVPTEEAAGVVGAALAGWPAGRAVTAAALREPLPAAEVLGPATLAYLAPAEFRPVAAGVGAGVDQLPGHHPAVRELELRVEPAEAAEADVGGVTSPAFVVRDGARVLAAAGYQHWPEGVAHLHALTDGGWRGRGLARATASAAVAHALAAGLLPQWRARPAASRRVARALGFRELGDQLSLRLAAPPH
ncbi:GNAT family N-acetyltransferase [Streptomyces sp. DSM 44915]|uniref:GNAT family N-acetyltransferase n=1 Tax=Streptomyces chisholmiae TaxID=3075540 RepID=A0ABU2JLR0_9ACTN|nr:GNAT family N-acetyltransferase [Streptomyces sp. DSM 44915]MDT0265904.1 GNAT family N-acetyltransferase [Streptomyces sp. DSM 44915]